jgi:hypothetical protein
MFSIHNRSDIDQGILRDIEFVRSALESSLIGYDSIYLVGSFGRGEGSVRFDGFRWKGINDYDLLVICPDELQITLSLKDLGSHLARQLAIDFVDIRCLSRSSLPTLIPTIEHYDLKYASLLLAGEDVRGEIPPFESEDVSCYEFVRLLCNRAAGLLTTWLPERLGSSVYCTNQYVKACIAAGDIAVYLNQGYHYSYQARFEAFRRLIENQQAPFVLTRESIDSIIKAYEIKLWASSPMAFSIERDLMQKIIQQVFCAIAERCTTKHFKTTLDAEKALNNHYQTRELIRKGMQDIFWKRNYNESYSIGLKNLILFSQPVFFCHCQPSGLKEHLAYLRRFWMIPHALQKEWNSVSAANMWEEYCH